MDAYAIDRVLYNWDYWSVGHAAVDRWDRHMFLDRVFSGWNTVVSIRHNDLTVTVLRLDDTFLVLPLTDPEDVRDSLRQSFDDALTNSVSGTSAIAVADRLVSNAIEASGTVSWQVTLMVEAVVLSAPEQEQGAIRAMMALRGMAQPNGYDQIT